MNYFSTIYNNYDYERVYSNDVKKIIQWYNLLIDKGGVFLIYYTK